MQRWSDPHNGQGKSGTLILSARWRGIKWRMVVRRLLETASKWFFVLLWGSSVT
jgi:hypothetical protein